MSLNLKMLGTNIQSKRKSKHLNQEELAYRVGISRNYLSMIETGKKEVSMLLPFPRLSALSDCCYRIIYRICQLQLFTVTAQSGAVFSLIDRFLFRLLIWC